MVEDGGGYLIRSGGVEDAKLIARQRAAMFRDMGTVSEEDAELLRNASEPWLRNHLINATYLGWLVEHGGAVVAGGGIFIGELGPVPGCYRMGRRGHIANLYTEPAHRRRGLARRLMETMLNWCESNGIDHVKRGASDEGRPLCESLGFEPTSEMKLAHGRA